MIKKNSQLKKLRTKNERVKKLKYFSQKLYSRIDSYHKQSPMNFSSTKY
jgi:hypothetical protein